MSVMRFLLVGEAVSSEEVNNVIIEFGGSIDKYQGVIQKGEATLWLYYRDGDLGFDPDEIEQIQDKLKIDPINVIAIELDSGIRSKRLSVNFSKFFKEKYPKSALIEDDESYIDLLLDK